MSQQTQISFSQLNGHQEGNFKSIQELGGVGDGVTDNYAALQAAANASMPIYFPPGTYNCSGKITQTVKSTHWFGPKYNTEEDDTDSDSQKTVRIVDTSGNTNPLYETTVFVDSGTVFENLYFDFNNSQSTDHFGCLFGPTGSSSDRADRDIKIINCTFARHGTAILVYGRGSLINNCLFITGHHAVDYDSNNPWVPPAGGNTSWELETGMRAHRITACRFHDHSGDAVVRSIGYNQKNLNGFNMTSCYSESVAGLFQGGGRNLLFSGNVFHSIDERPIFDLWDVDGCTITGNTFGGEFDLDDDDTVRHEHDPWNFVRFNQDYSAAARTSYFGDHPHPYQVTVTITRAGSTATVSHTAHGMVNEQYVLIAGANETEYNGTHQIFNVTTNSYDFNVSGTPATPATGTITATGIFRQQGVTITGNSVQNVYKNVFELKSQWENIVISGNQFYDVCRVSSNTGLDAGQVGYFLDMEHKGRGLVIEGNVIQAANPSGAWTRKDALISTSGLSSTDYEDWIVANNSWSDDHWTREHNMTPVTQSSGAAVWVAGYTGNASDPKITTPPFTPSSVIISCISGTNAGAIMGNVVGNPSTGDVRINGFNVEAYNTMNASGDTYTVMCFR